jgi:2,4-dienoyl-CoA reductase (NADPH2)
VRGYAEVLTGAQVGERVVIIGAGGIGFDVAEFLVQGGESPTLDPDLWRREWGVGDPGVTPGGLAAGGPDPEPPARQVTMLQRKTGRPGRGLGKTTGWIHRAALAMKGVEMRGGVSYERITPEGLELREGEAAAVSVIAADTIVLCAGQQPRRELSDALLAAGMVPYLIGGASEATELDAKRAIDQGARLAARL